MQDEKKSGDSSSKLLKTIQRGLKHYSGEELNKEIEKLLDNKSDRHEEREYIITIVCSHFSITRRALMKSRHRNGIMEPRHLTFCLLHQELGMSTRQIASSVFDYTSHTRVAEAIRRFKSLDVTIKVDREFKAKYQTLQQKLTNFINAKKTNIESHG